MNYLAKSLAILGTLFFLSACEPLEDVGTQEDSSYYWVCVDKSDAKILLKSGENYLPAASRKLDVNVTVNFKEAYKGLIRNNSRTQKRTFQTNPSGNILVTYSKMADGTSYNFSDQSFVFETDKYTGSGGGSPVITEILSLEISFSTVVNGREYKNKFVYDQEAYLWSAIEGLFPLFGSDLPKFEISKSTGRDAGKWLVKLTDDIVLN